MSSRSVHRIVSGLLVTAVTASAAAAQTTATAVAAGEGEVAASELIEFAVTVEKVDVAAREVTVRHDEGGVETIRVGDEVQRLDEVRAGDRVGLAVYRSLTLSLERVEGGEASATGTGFDLRSEPGELPGGIATRQITLTAKVTAVDAEKSTVALVGPRGRSAVLEVDEAVLAAVAVGDLVTAVYTEALAVALERVPAEQ